MNAASREQLRRRLLALVAAGAGSRGLGGACIGCGRLRGETHTLSCERGGRHGPACTASYRTHTKDCPFATDGEYDGWRLLRFLDGQEETR